MRNLMKGLPKGLIEASGTAMGGDVEDAIVVRQDMAEGLKGKQYKLDVHKDGKIDGKDFAKLRKGHRVKEALERGVAKSNIVEIRAPGLSALNGQVGEVIHFNRLRNEATIKVEDKTYKLRKGSYFPVSEQLIDEAKKMKGKDPCWDSHEMVGHKMKNGKKVPNCVPKEEVETEAEETIEETEEEVSEEDKELLAQVEAELAGVEEEASDSEDIEEMSEEEEVSEEAEQIDEISADTARSYIKKAGDEAKATYKGRGRKSKATLKVRAKREGGIEKAKKIVAAHNEKEWAKKEKARADAHSALGDHFEKSHGEILAKHGFKLQHSGHHDDNSGRGEKDHVRTYIKHHENGHVTVASVAKKGADDDHHFSRSTHEVKVSNSKGTSWSTHHVRLNGWRDHDVEHEKKKAEVDFHDHIKDASERGERHGHW